MEKKFLPAELVEWKDRWSITFYQVNPATGERKRFRKTYDLNRIKSISERRKRARVIIKELNEELLPYGYPFVEVKKDALRMKVVPALEYAISLKRSPKGNSYNSYRYYINLLIEYLEKKKLLEEDISILTKKEVVFFLDYLSGFRKHKNVTRNTVATGLRSLFTELKDREIIDSNPFSNFNKLKEEEKERRPLNNNEKKILSEYIYENDKRLYLAVIIMYYCFIRRAELMRLKFRYFDFNENVIRVPGVTNKNSNSEILTMPRQLASLLLNEYRFYEQPQHWFLFGRKLNAGRDAGGKNSLSLRHRKCVNYLAKKGELIDGDSIHLYSWKDTGVHNMINKGYSIIDIQKQLRHKDLRTTQRYITYFSGTNTRILNMPTDI